MADPKVILDDSELGIVDPASDEVDEKIDSLPTEKTN